jgi:hypothetical protein
VGIEELEEDLFQDDYANDEHVMESWKYLKEKPNIIPIYHGIVSEGLKNITYWITVMYSFLCSL